MTSSAFYASHHHSLSREMQESAHEAAAARPLHLLRPLQTMVEGGRTSSSPSSPPAAGREGNGQLEMEQRWSPPGAAALARWEERREAAAALGVESAKRGRRDAGDRSDPAALHGVAAEARGWRRRRGRGARTEEEARMEEEARTRLGFVGKTRPARSRSCPRCLPFWPAEKTKIPWAR
ncbi:hypothetical protein CFC21_032307 [Triticum aestivum]|uniref:Uncharacterized protein n=2 Tax=Triticum aestivum TaxID=4565 RepID=A0A3B6DLL7_WHEAT|nr:hypothetical protein CFC21_032307 [Triticum aestivum]